MAGARLDSTEITSPEAPLDCERCIRLRAYCVENARRFPDWFNAPVPSFGEAGARLLVVGLAPGLKGANRTGRPFTGDYAGDLLYKTLSNFGWGVGAYQARADDGYTLAGAMITNAVRCVPPENKPTPAEASNCLGFLTARIKAMPNLKITLALGRLAHDSVLRALGLRVSRFPFAHRAAHDVGGGVTLIDSYHCSRYNTNTGRLTEEMFFAVFSDIAALTKAEKICD